MTKRIKLSEPQSKIFLDKTRFQVIPTGRRFGKTYLLLVCALKITSVSGKNCFYIAPTYRQAKQVAWRDIKSMIPMDFVTKISETDLDIEFTNGSLLGLRGAEYYDRLRGIRINEALFDEIENINPLTWEEVIRPALADTEGGAKFAGTPKGKGHFYKLYKYAKESGDPDWKAWQFTTLDGGRVSKSEIDKARKVMTERQYRQEFLATFEEIVGALWQQDNIDLLRINSVTVPFERIVIAIDPAVTADENSDETGIIVAAKGLDGHFYVLEDASGTYTPFEWASRAIELFWKYKADRIIGEANNGGDLVCENILVHNRNLPVKKVHASRGKIARAEPIAALYENGMAHHVGNNFFELEEQMCHYAPSEKYQDSPDRMDALVWGGKELMLPDDEQIIVEYQEDYQIAKY